MLMNNPQPPDTTPRFRWSFDRERLGVWAKRAGIAAVVAAVVFVIGSAFAYQHYGAEFVPPDLMSVNTPAGGAKVYDRNGTLLYQYIDDRDGPVSYTHLTLPTNREV